MGAVIRYLDTSYNCQICGKHRGKGSNHSVCSRELQKRSKLSGAQRKMPDDKLVRWYDDFLKHKI